MDAEDLTAATGRKLVPVDRHPGIFARGSGFVVRFRDHNGRQRQRAAPTLTAAKALKAALVTDVRRGEFRALSRVSFAKYADDWGKGYNGRTGRGLRPETLRDYKRDLEQHVTPYFGRRLLAEIEMRDIKALARHLAKQGKAPGTVRNILAPLRALLATAVEEGLIRHNPAAGLRLPGGGSKAQPKALTPEELTRLIAAMPEGQPRLLVRFLAVTGLRISELVGLTWADIDITARRVKVRRRIREGKVADPKSRYGIRDIPLSETMVGDLAAHRLASPHSGDPDPVFASATGTPLLPENFVRRFLKPAAKAAGLVDADGTPWPAFHVLRHTCATNLLRAGVPPKSVQLWLGHHAAAFTLDTYGHLLSDDLPDGEVLDRFVNGEGVNSGSTSPPERTGEVDALPTLKTT